MYVLVKFLLIASISIVLAGCGGDGSTENLSKPVNISPNAAAGNDLSVTEGTTVTLNGNGNDPDGQIASYGWTQVSGDLVRLNNSSSEDASFIAPTTESSLELSFRFTVTDDKGATAVDEIDITILPTAPSQFSYSSVINVNVGQDVLIQPEYEGFVASFILTGELPEGLSFDSSTGVIDGSPQESTDSIELQVTASNDGGAATTFILTVLSRITINNFENNHTLRYDLPLLRGTAPGSESIIIDNNGVASQYSVNAGRWRGFVSLREGKNNLILTTSGGDSTPLILNFQPMDNEKVVRLVYLLGSDSTGEFDAPPGVTNTLDDAIPRLQLAGRIIQSLTAELIAEKGFPRKTFRLLRGADRLPIVDTPVSSLSVAQLRKLGEMELWSHFSDLLQNLPNRDNIIDVAIIADSHYDPDIQSLTPLAHTALGGFPLALYGSASIHSWPTKVGLIESRFSDQTLTEPFLFAEIGRSNQYWANVTTSMGAVMHELGHAFGLPHPDPSEPPNIMNRGFDYLNRMIVTFEPGHGAIDPDVDVMPRWCDSNVAILQNSPWL